MVSMKVEFSCALRLDHRLAAPAELPVEGEPQDRVEHQRRDDDEARAGGL